MAFDAFVIFGGVGDGAVAIEGETLDETMSKHKAFEIDSFGFGVENTINIGSKSGGAGAGKASFKEFTIEKATDSGSAGLFTTCCCGGHYTDVKLILRRSGGDAHKSGTPFLEYRFKLVAVKSIDWSGSTGDDVPKETVVFEYGAIEIEYTPQTASGGKGSKQFVKHWSRVKNNDSFTV